MSELNDDLSPEYGNHRTLLAQNTAGSELLMRFGNKSGELAPTKPNKEEGQNNNTSVAEPVSALSMAGAVASDIGRGIVDAPGAILSGAQDAVQEFFDSTRDLADWIDGHLGIEVDPVEERLQLPEFPESFEPDSNTGSMVKGIAQFLTGFGVAGKALKAIKPVSKAGQISKVMVQGAVADATVFDPHEQRLANLIQDHPDLQNPITEYLAAQPGDSNAEGRFKNALEGLGLGVVTDGFFTAMRAMRGAAVAKRIEADKSRVPGSVEEIKPEIPQETLEEILGKEEDELVKLPRGNPPAKQDPDLPPSESESGDTFINFSRINEPEDVQEVMKTMADAHKSDIDAARRGEKKSFAEMELDAEHINAFEVLQSRRQGEPLNAEQSIAARQLWATSASKLSSLSKVAAAEPSEANLFAFRKMMAVHRTIQNEVIAARTETARALASWRIPAGSGAERFMEIENMLTAHGGADLSREMAQRVATLADKGMIQEMDQFIEKSAWARSRDAAIEGWINGLLSGPKTHLVNAISNISVLFQQMYERHTAAKIATILGDESSVQLGEATAQFFGMVSGLKDAFRYAGKAFATGESGYGLGKVETERLDAISSEALNISNSGFLGKTVDVLGAGIRVPTRALGAADEFFKTLGYRMEINAQALRQASQEVNAGTITNEEIKERIAEIVANPPENIRLAAVDQATYQTFTNTPGDLAQGISNLKAKFPAFNIIMPFVRTPANIMRYTFERTPLAPLMKHYRADIAAGGARRDLALAKVATGTSIMMMTADMAMTGTITGQGPSDSSERSALMRQGWQPYSVKIGDRYFAYNRMDPIGMTMGLAADMTDISANDEFGTEKEKSIEELGVAVVLSIANNSMSKTYLSGLSEFFNAMADPDRHGENYFQRFASSIIPTGVGEVARFNDPYMREANTMVEAMRRKVPGLSDDLPPRRNLWGEPISYQSGLGSAYDMLSPIYSKSKKTSAIDEEILRLEATINMPGKKTSIDGVTVNLERYQGAYSRFVQLAGNELKHPAWELGARDFLNQLVSGKHQLSPVYDMRSDGPDGGKSDYLKKILNDYRNLARQELLKEFPEIKAEVDEKKREKRRLKMPVFGGQGEKENA